MINNELTVVYRIFNLISLLRSPYGCSKQNFVRRYQISERTFQRYIKLLKDELGFNIIKTKNNYHLQTYHSELKHEELFVFTLPEAELIQQALINNNIKHPIQKTLLSKLASLSELPEIITEIQQQKSNNHIALIRQAIKNQQQIQLINYHSVNGNTISNRKLEPIKFIKFFRYLIAYEIASKKNKQFKTDRIEEVKILKTKTQYIQNQSTFSTDDFGMSGTKAKSVSIQLSLRAYKLLCEEFDIPSKYLVKNEQNYYYKGEVQQWEGIGRFLLGLIDEVKILAPMELQKYVLEKLKAGKNKNI